MLRGTRGWTAVMLLSAGAARGQEAASGAVKQVAYARVALARSIARDPELLRAVAAKNTENEPAATIQKRDREWTENPSSALRKSLTESPCARRLRELIKDDPLVIEAILMDAQGAGVCLSRETSDYWQGDEAKWQKTFVEGRDVFVDEPAFDASSDTFGVQLSVPVAEGQRRIGALTLTLKVRKDLLPGVGK